MNEAIEVAVKWWCDKIGGFIELKRNDAGDAKLNATMALFGSMRNPLLPDQIVRFGDALRRLLPPEVEKCGARGWGATLDVDYYPSGILAQAAEEAKIPDTLYFPCKTHMEVKPYQVTVACGYAAPWVEIFKAPLPALHES